jgi:hypothetical protein
MGSNTNISTITTQTTQRLSALEKYVSARTDIPIAGKKMKGSALMALYQSVLDANEGVTSTKGSYKLALEARDEAEAQRKVADESLRSWVLITYGPTSQEAHDFGFVPKVRATATTETKATAVALRTATRVARGTRGKKEKLKIKGSLATPVVTPPASATPVVAQAQAPASVVAAAPVAAPSAPAVPPVTPSVTSGAPVAAHS